MSFHLNLDRIKPSMLHPMCSPRIRVIAGKRPPSRRLTVFFFLIFIIDFIKGRKVCDRNPYLIHHISKKQIKIIGIVGSNMVRYERKIAIKEIISMRLIKSVA